MIDLQPNLTRFNHELTLLQQALKVWHDELATRESQVLKDTANVKRQREELIHKSNLIVEQVNGLRGQKEQSAQKMLEAEKLKKSAVESLETAENMRAEMSLKENELELREKNIKLLTEREAKVKQDEEKLTNEKAEFLKAQTLLKKEQELLDEKQQVILIREQKADIREAKQKRIMSDI